MSIEFFRPESQRPLDADGFELPPWLNPFLSDYNPELVEAADVAWLNENPTLPPISGGSPEPFEPSDADWDDYFKFRESEDAAEYAARMQRTDDEAADRYNLFHL